MNVLADHPGSDGVYYRLESDEMGSPIRPSNKEDDEKEERLKSDQQLLQPKSWMECIEGDSSVLNLKRLKIRQELRTTYWLVEVWKPNLMFKDVLDLMRSKYKEASLDAGGLLKGIHARIWKTIRHQFILRGIGTNSYTKCCGYRK